MPCKLVSSGLTYHLQCDETWPTCERCKHSGFRDCDLLLVRTLHITAQSVLRSSQLLPMATSGQDHDLRQLDLELMHHWSTSTFDTVAVDPNIRQFWRKNVVQIGFGCDFVMKAILSVAALHIAQLQPYRRPRMLPYAWTLYSSASESARGCMGKDSRNPDEMDNLFTFSMLTMIYSAFHVFPYRLNRS